MKKKTAKILGLCIIALALVTGCKKGDKGDKGDPGVAGTSGTNGTNGNANVTCVIVNANAASWTSSGVTWYVDLFPSNVTSSAADSGVVIVYMESSTQAGAWLNMPWIDEPSATYFSTYNYAYATGTIRVSKYDSDLTLPSAPGLRKFKVIAIPPALKKPGISNASNYFEVMEAYGLKE